MHTASETLPDKHQISCDICIVGGGAAGISLAREFKGTPFKVALMEAGGFELTTESQNFYKGQATGTMNSVADFYLETSRLRYLGGTTNHWSGFCIPFSPEDFEKRDYIPHSGWPIQYQDIQGYYTKAAPICDVGSFNYDRRKLFSDEDIPLFWSEKSGSHPDIEMQVFHRSSPTRFGQKYRSDLEDSKNIHLYTNANCTGLKLTENKSEVIGATFKSFQGKGFEVKAKNFVLACGGLENPRLLLNAHINPGDNVGRYFMEHPHVPTGYVFAYKNYEQLRAFNRQIQKTGASKRVKAIFTTSKKFREEKKTLQFSAELDLDNQNWLKTWEGKIKRWFSGEKREKRQNELMAEAIRGFDGAKNKEFSYGHLFGRVEQVPNPESRVTLLNESDALGLKKLKLNWKTTDLDTRSFMLSSLLLAENFGLSGLGRATVEMQSDFKWPLGARGGSHHMGTTRMASSEKTGVVDRHAKVFGTSNLYMAGSSIFTTGGFANPTLSIVAFALRLADHLKKEPHRA